MPKFCLLFLLIFHFCIVLTQPCLADTSSQKEKTNAVQINSNFDKSSLLGNLYVFTTADSSVTVHDLLAHPIDFQPIEQEVPDLGVDNRYHWIKFRINNTTTLPQELVSYLHLNELSDLSFYVVNDSNRVTYQQEHLNAKIHMDKKPIPGFYFAFPISLQAKQNATVFLRIYRNEGSVIFPLRLYSKNAFFFFKTQYDFFGYLTYGVLAFTILLSGGLFFFTRYKLLSIYAGYCLSLLFLTMSNEGVLMQYFHLDFPFLEENARMFFAAIVLYYTLQFSALFLHIQDYAPRWLSKFVTIFAYFWLIIGLLSLFISFGSSITAIFGLLILLGLFLVFLLIFYGVFKRRREAFIYFVAVTPFYFSNIWFAITLFSNLEITWFYYQLILYQTLFEFIVLGLELGYRMVNDRNNYLQRLNQLQWNFTTSILNAQDSERERIASDLHDDLGGTIATIRRRVSDIKTRFTNIDLVKELDELEPMIKKSGDDLRRISHNLMPPEFARIGLVNSLTQLVQSLPKLPTRFEFLTAGIEKKLPVDIELNIYRIVSELIQNILKHAEAKHATVQMLFFHDELRIIVEDNGVGNLSAKSTDTSAGLGVKNCNLRANYIGAKLSREVSSAGTFVVLDIPYSSTTYESITSDEDTLS